MPRLSTEGGAFNDVLHRIATDAGPEIAEAVDRRLGGPMAGSPSMRLGLALKNLRSPSFRATTGSVFVLPRQARIGVAVLPADGVTLAMDLDLNTVDLMGDLRRMLAVGGETSVGSRVRPPQ